MLPLREEENILVISLADGRTNVTYYPTISDSQSSRRQAANIGDGSLYALIRASVGGHRLSNSNTIPLSKLAAINSFGAVVSVDTHELSPVGISHFFISLSASHNRIDFESPPTTIVWDRCCQHVDSPRASGNDENKKMKFVVCTGTGLHLLLTFLLA